VCVPAGAEGKTLWLCHPGQRADPCSGSLTTTRLSPEGRPLGVQRVRRARVRAVDCFYVYPTVSEQPEPQATLRVDPELRSVALYQATRFSRDCRVFAPVYRQITLRGLFSGRATAEMFEQAYADLRNAWRGYLRGENRGRGVVILGHSQGTIALRRLIAEEVDRKRSVRRRLVSAVLLGGGVTVRRNRDAGGDFRNIPACRAPAQLRCVVAYSTFNEPVPADAKFGRTTAPDREVLCTNPAALRGGSGLVETIIPTTPSRRV